MLLSMMGHIRRGHTVVSCLLSCAAQLLQCNRPAPWVQSTTPVGFERIKAAYLFQGELAGLVCWLAPPLCCPGLWETREPQLSRDLALGPGADRLSREGNKPSRH